MSKCSENRAYRQGLYPTSYLITESMDSAFVHLLTTQQSHTSTTHKDSPYNLYTTHNHHDSTPPPPPPPPPPTRRPRSLQRHPIPDPRPPAPVPHGSRQVPPRRRRPGIPPQARRTHPGGRLEGGAGLEEAELCAAARGGEGGADAG